MIYIVGSRGRLGRQIAIEYGSTKVISLDRNTYQDWSISGGEKKVSLYFGDKANNRSIIFVTSGLLNPNSSSEDLYKVNYNLPKNILKGTSQLGVKVVTFGTIMEDNVITENNYIQSKLALSEFISASSEIDLALHLKIHTLFGVGMPSPFMFLGQMLSAICQGQVFKMTSGNQLREYHHVVDEVRAIREAVEQNQLGVLNLSHGIPVRLKDVAKAVFKRMDRKLLLSVGVVPEPIKENYDLTYNRSNFLKRTQFRDSIPAIVEYIYQSYIECVTRRI